MIHFILTSTWTHMQYVQVDAIKPQYWGGMMHALTHYAQTCGCHVHIRRIHW